MAKITGIGGVFFKSKGDSAALAAWYRKHLGLPLEDFGRAVLRWPNDTSEDRGFLEDNSQHPRKIMIG